MIEALGVFWLRPVWLAAIPLAVLAAILLRRRAGGFGAWEGAVDPALLARMRAMGRVAPGGKWRDWPAAALIAALALALAGPAQERRDGRSWRNLDAVVIVLDISPSLTEGENFEDALTAARLIAARAVTRQAALVVFAGEAWLASAFTTDPAALGGAISLIAPDTAPTPGTRPEEGLALAARALDDADVIAGEVVLIGDGGGLGSEATAWTLRLKARGAPVSTIVVGETGRDRMAALAAEGGGAAGDLANPFAVAERVAAVDASRIAAAGYPLLAWADRGRWLLALALIPAFLMLPRRGAR